MSDLLFASPIAPLILLLALAADGIAGRPPSSAPRLPTPTSMTRKLVEELDRRLNRPQRGETTLLVRGVMVVTVLLLLGLGGGLLASWLSHTIPYGFFLELFLVFACISAREPWHRTAEIRRLIGRDGPEAVRTVLQGQGVEHAGSLDQFGMVRVALERLVKALNQTVVAPGFWYLLLGLPGLLLWVVIDTADDVIGRRSFDYRNFGLTSARLDDALNFIPARLTGFIICASAAFLGSANPLAAVRTMWLHARYHRSINAGWPQAALAGALNLALGGPRQIGDTLVRDVWIGNGRARASEHDLTRAMALYGISVLVFAGLVAVWLALLLSL